MHDIAIGETAQDMGNGVDLANMPEKLVAEALAAGGAADQPGDIDKFQLGRDDLGRFAEARGDIEPFVGNRHSPEIWLDRAERVIRRLGRGGRGQRIEERGFADIRQSDNAAAETHRFVLSSRLRVSGLCAIIRRREAARHLAHEGVRRAGHQQRDRLRHRAEQRFDPAGQLLTGKIL